jgi:hypothetical protein
MVTRAPRSPCWLLLNGAGHRLAFLRGRGHVECGLFATEEAARVTFLPPRPFFRNSGRFLLLEEDETHNSQATGFARKNLRFYEKKSAAGKTAKERSRSHRYERFSK